METIFPDGTAYDGLFVVGVRRGAGGVERTGTVVLKRTYDVDPSTGALAPSEAPVPVFMQDRPDNLLRNSDFEQPLADDEGAPADWVPEGVTLASFPDPAATPDEPNLLLSASGPARGRVVQTLSFDEPLGGRTFSLSLEASAAAAPARVEDVRLEAGGVVRCTISRDLGAAMQRLTATGTWPASVQATEMDVVLRTATSAGRTVYYDRVQVEERPYATQWDPEGVPRYEHDLAAFKPEGDLVVLDLTGAAGTVRARVDGVVRLTRALGAAGPPVKSVFGWEPRAVDPRKAEAAFPEDDAAYPLPAPLPAAFDNRFYNGYRRSGGVTAAAPLPYWPATADVRLERGGTLVYRCTLRGDAPTARYHYYRGTGPDAPPRWRTQALPMNLDTLVLEPARDRCYAVWRGVWPFDERPEERYRRLEVTAT